MFWVATDVSCCCHGNQPAGHTDHVTPQSAPKEGSRGEEKRVEGRIQGREEKEMEKEETNRQQETWRGNKEARRDDTWVVDMDRGDKMRRRGDGRTHELRTEQL